MLRLLIGCLVLNLAVAAQAADSWNRRKAKLDRFHRAGEFRVFYTLSGVRDALPPAARRDADEDGTPDFVQDVAAQLVAARRVFTEVLGLRHPLKSPRYGGKPEVVNVNLMDFDDDGNGTTYDELSWTRRGDDPSEVHSLAMDLSRKLKADNVTMAHEVFHLFQNGYTMFRNRWYMEGTARWSESAVDRDGYPAGRVPETDAERAELFRKSYDAVGFWNRVCLDADPEGTPIPRELRELRYPGSGKPIITAEKVHGAAYVKALLEGLEEADLAMSREKGREPYRWSEDEQRSPDNDAAIWAAAFRARL